MASFRNSQRLVDLKACEACKSSKRKCTKQLPRCRRCETRGLLCVYGSRPNMIIYRVHDGGRPFSSREAIPSSPETSWPSDFGYVTSGVISEATEINSPVKSRNSKCPSLDDLRSAWFLTPEAWKVTALDTSHLAPISGAAINDYVDKVKQWLRDWVRTGSNPFIHPQLYNTSMPSCIQHAFMALSTYESKTGKTEDMVRRLIEETANGLVASESGEDNPKDTLHGLARVQSLLTYCVIRLFDGDVRQRNFAESHLPILQDWTIQLLQNASQAARDDTLLLHNALTNYTPQITPQVHIPMQASPEKLLWHAWILSESVRRTWYVSMFIQAGYLMLKTGIGPCRGGVPFTTRDGVWAAQSASAWTKTCAERSVGFMHRNDTEGLFTELTSDEVDEFTLALMEMDFGLERTQEWQLNSE